jgi:hypothetical protein
MSKKDLINSFSQDLNSCFYRNLDKGAVKPNLLRTIIIFFLCSPGTPQRL